MHVQKHKIITIYIYITNPATYFIVIYLMKCKLLSAVFITEIDYTFIA